MGGHHPPIRARRAGHHNYLRSIRNADNTLVAQWTKAYEMMIHLVLKYKHCASTKVEYAPVKGMHTVECLLYLIERGINISFTARIIGQT